MMDTVEKIKKGNVDIADLLEYVASNDFEIAMAATESIYATPAILSVAARDNDKRIRIAAVKNPNISDDTIRFLCEDKDFDVSNLAREIAKGKCL